MKIIKVETIQNNQWNVQFVVIKDIDEIERIESQCEIDDDIADWKVKVLDEFDYINTIQFVTSHMTWEDYKFMHKHLDEIDI